MEEAFLTWFKRVGGTLHPGLNLFAELSNGDRGVVATEAIEEGTTLVTVPHSITIHAPTPEQLKKSGHEVWSYLSKEHPGTSSFISTVLVLLSELARGKESDMLPYLDSLPTDCSCMLNWTEGERSELKGTAVESTGDSPEQVFQQEVLPRMSGMPQLWPAPFNTLPQFLRVAALVQSRAFHLESNNWVTGARQEGSELYLIPAIDMINHSTDPALRNTSLHSCSAAAADADAKNSTGAGPAVAATFTMKAEKPLKAGDQVLHTYGDLSDAQLLQIYGFVDLPAPSGSPGRSAEPWTHNAHNLVCVPMDAVVEACRAALSRASRGNKKELRAFDASLPRKLSLLTSAKVLQPTPPPQQASLAEPQPQAFIVTNADPLPDNLLTALQVLLMDEGDVKELQQEYGQKRGKKQKKQSGAGPSTSAGAADSSPLSLGSVLIEEDEGFAQLFILALIQLVDKSLLRYQSCVKDDEQLVKQGAAAASCGRLWLAALVRLGERHVLLGMKKKGLALLMGAGSGGESEEGEAEGGEGEEGEEEEDEGEEEGA